MCSIGTVAKNNSSKYDSVQALRGIAALLVVLCHIHFINAGSFGVDIFFCISGFIMMHVTEKSSKNFLLKRAIRVIPLYWGITLVTFFAALKFPHLFHTSEATPEYLIKSLLFIPYSRNGITQPMLGVGWSLNYEIAFYILFFIGTKISQKHRAIITSSVLLAIVILGHLIKTENVAFNFFTDAIILEFALGMLAFYILNLFKDHSIKTIGFNTGGVIPCVIIAILMLMFFTEKMMFHRLFKWGILALALFILVFRYFQNRIVPKPFVILGNISFSLYLVHYYTIFFFDRLVYSFDKITPISSVVAVIAVATSIGVAWISWWLIENKFTNFLRIRLKV